MSVVTIWICAMYVKIRYDLPQTTQMKFKSSSEWNCLVTLTIKHYSRQFVRTYKRRNHLVYQLDYTVTTAHNGQLCGIFGDGVNIPPNCATIGQRLLMHYFISHKEGQQHFLFRIKNYTPNFMDRLFHLWLIPKKKLQFSLELELISSYVVLWCFLATVTDTWN